MSEVAKEPETVTDENGTVVDEGEKAALSTTATETTEITEAEEEAANTSTKRARESDDEQTSDSELKKDDTKRTKLDEDTKDLTTTTTTEESEDSKAEEESKAGEESKSEEKPKFVFGSTTTFGSAGGFSMFGAGKNVFGGSTFGSSSPFGSVTPKESKPVENKSEEEKLSSSKSITATATETETEEKEKTETTTNTDEDKNSTESEKTETTKPTPSVFGSGSSFGNAFQMSINKKSIFDTNGEESKEEKKQDGESQIRDGYQVVHLQKQAVKSGEEDETTLISVKAKLYHLDLTNVSDGWKEKGIGILKVNKLSKPQENYSTRIVMRQDGIYKLILNVPVVKGFEVYRGMTSSLSSAKFVRIQFIENGKPTQYALKMSLDNAANLYEIIEPLIPK